MSEVKRQFGGLIRHATHKGRLVIIVDDLERCTSERALEVCQVASQLLAQPGVVTILLADMEPIARSAGARYAESMPNGASVDPEEIGRRYLAKIVQLEIALPPPAPEDMRRVIRDYGPSLRHALPESLTEVRSWSPQRIRRRPQFKGRHRTAPVVAAACVARVRDRLRRVHPGLVGERGRRPRLGPLEPALLPGARARLVLVGAASPLP